jgi:hypothetical protein
MSSRLIRTASSASLGNSTENELEDIIPSTGLVGITSGNASPPPPVYIPPPPPSSPPPSSVPSAAVAAVPSWRANLKPLLDTAITELKTFRFDPKAEVFAKQLEAIAAIEKELDILEGTVRKLTGEATQLDTQLRSSGMLPKGVLNFKGKNGPSVYAAKKGASFEARGNFMINAYPFRVQNDASFDAVLEKMKTQQATVSSLISKARVKRNELLTAQAQLNNKGKEYIGKIKALRKSVAEEAASLSQMARKAARTRITARPNQAQNVLSAYAEKKPGFFNRLFKRSGGTRKRSATRKTRKNRRNSRK